jgi:hypothetical protein
MCELHIVKTETPYEFCAGCGACTPDTIAIYDLFTDRPVIEMCPSCAASIVAQLNVVLKNKASVKCL